MINELKKILEFDLIINHIANNCVSDTGKVRLLNSELIFSEQELTTKLKEISEAKEIFQAEGGIPIWHFVSVIEILHKIEPIGSYLDIEACLALNNFIDICAEITKFFNKHKERFLTLQNHSNRLEELSSLSQLIKNTIDPTGRIYDNASKELKRIRCDIEFQSKQIHIILDRIRRKKAEHLQEDYITLREDRLVLPVREFSVNKIPGIVHGQSGTGQTHFIEPLEVVKLNNELHELYREEKKEIIKILQRVSDNIRNKSNELLINFDIITNFDVIAAKAKYSISVYGSAPQINDQFFWDIRKGYHPVLLRKLSDKAVPLNLKIGQDERILIISGPNAGGKTVAIKTVGLLQLLFQFGFHIPVEEGSTFPICTNISAVIGDEQSIENDLSTFSSHITNINNILRNINDKSLILIDEIGSGTDPSEGSALAIAILDELNQSSIISIVTTHQSALKEYAHKTQFVQNAAMQFNIDTLEPLFKIDVGLPGSSYAFEISKRLGLDEKLLTKAKEIRGSSSNELDNLIIELSKQKQEYENKLNTLSVQKSELNGLKKLYTQRTEEFNKRKKQLENEARDEANKILENVNKTIENVIFDIKESQADPIVVKEARNTIKNLKKIQNPKKTTKEVKLEYSDLQTGQTVKSIKFDVFGQIIAVNKDKKEVDIESKDVRIKVPFEDVEIISGKPNEKNCSGRRPVIQDTSFEIDLRGYRAEEALIELDKYLDSALHSGWKELRIIHGKGTGALRQGIHAFLKKNSLIKTFRLGKYGEGDSGVTVVEI